VEVEEQEEEAEEEGAWVVVEVEVDVGDEKQRRKMSRASLCMLCASIMSIGRKGGVSLYIYVTS